MSPLIKELLMNGLLAGTALQTAKNKSASVGYNALAGGIAALGFVFLAIAGYGVLLQYFVMPVAAAIVGGVILFLSACVCAWGQHRTNAKKIIRKPLDGSFLDNVEHTLKSLVDGFEDPVKDNPKVALLLAALAGFAAGDQLGDRVSKH